MCLFCIGYYYKTVCSVHKKYPIRMAAFYCSCIILICSVIVTSTKRVSNAENRRNIVLIVADDLGWNDVSLHGRDQVLTPNIDTLGYSGVTLARYYSHCFCTPSRSALLTGKYAHVIGMQGYPLTNSEDRGLPLTEKILPQYLKELGYATHLVGKWHVGSSRKNYLPTKRGFDSHFGHRGGFIDYYEYTLEEEWQIGKVSGMDLFRNESPAWDVEGYITDVYTNEAVSVIKKHDVSKPLFLMLSHNAPHGSHEGALLQAPPHEVRAMRYVESPQRRIYAAMMKKLDDSVGDVIEALSQKGVINNTIILFLSDNGAMTSGISINYGSNWPLRGLKMSPFEGGVRVTGALWAPEKISNHLYEGYIHVSDWLPTLLAAIGEKPPENIDGLNLWDAIVKNQEFKRHDIVEIDDLTGFATIISDDFKLLTGKVNPAYSNYQGDQLLGIIGHVPSYTDAIVNCKSFRVFNDFGKTVEIDDMKIRKRIRITCKKPDNESQKDCYPEIGKVCLYNIREDPCESNDLSSKHPDIVERLFARLEHEKKRIIPRVTPLFRDPKSHPALYNYTWNIFI